MHEAFCLSDNVVRGRRKVRHLQPVLIHTYKNVTLDRDHGADSLQPGRRLCQSPAKKKSDQQHFTVPQNVVESPIRSQTTRQHNAKCGLTLGINHGAIAADQGDDALGMWFGNDKSQGNLKQDQSQLHFRTVALLVLCSEGMLGSCSLTTSFQNLGLKLLLQFLFVCLFSKKKYIN